VVVIWEVEGENGKTPVFSPYNVSDHYVEMQSPFPFSFTYSMGNPYDLTNLVKSPQKIRKEVSGGMKVWRGGGEMIKDETEG
jgi:hypothetical protein